MSNSEKSIQCKIYRAKLKNGDKNNYVDFETEGAMNIWIKSTFSPHSHYDISIIYPKKIKERYIVRFPNNTGNNDFYFPNVKAVVEYCDKMDQDIPGQQYDVIFDWTYE